MNITCTICTGQCVASAVTQSKNETQLKQLSAFVVGNGKALKKSMLTQFVKIAVMLCVVMFTANISSAADRCVEYIQEARVQATKYFGLSFPYWYFIGQMRQESNCRANIVSFDGGRGLTQFMPATQKYVENSFGRKFNIFDSQDAILAQVYYMSVLHKENWHEQKLLWLTFMLYNSGGSILRKEYNAAGKIADYEKMKAVCKRKVLTLKSGKHLDLCDVGYDYPVRIYRYGNIYKHIDTNAGTAWRFW